MKLERYSTAAAFRFDADPFCSRTRLSIASRWGLSTHSSATRRQYLFAVKDEGGDIGAAWMTPPFPLGLSRMSIGTMKMIFEEACRLPAALLDEAIRRSGFTLRH